MTETLLSKAVALPVALCAVLAEYGESLYEVAGGLAGGLAGPKGKLLVGGVEIAIKPSSTVESLLAALAAKGVTEGSYGVKAGFGIKKMPYPMVTEFVPVFALA